MNKILSINAQSENDKVVIGIELHGSANPKAQYDAIIASVKSFADVFAMQASVFDKNITREVVIGRIIDDLKAPMQFENENTENSES